MIRAKARYRGQTLELDQPLALAEGTEGEIDIRVAEEAQESERQAWAELGARRLEEEWDNPEDAVYDDWTRV
ncbi:MAG: hypothetical protein NTW86_24760 [Candidatus Sumerlaeota bacterium]|nr:hypothetical protein [Candidatus Sumerlaeota bacterium]